MIWFFENMLARRLIIWSVLSLITGMILLFTAGDFWRAFGLQAVVWALIDAAVALYGLWASGKKLHHRAVLAESQQEAQKIRKILSVSLLFDLLFLIAGGILILTKGKADPGWSGAGWGIAVQSVFLLLFDGLHWKTVPNERLLPDWNLFQTARHSRYQIGEGNRAVLLVHGYPGSPAEVRDLGEAIAQRGWTVRGMALPGMGEDIRNLFLYRAEDWQQAVREELVDLRRAYPTVILIGYSLGGGLAVPVAADIKPAGLVLLAPFWYGNHNLVALLQGILRPLLPTSLPVFRYLDFQSPMVQKSMVRMMQELDFNSPEVVESLRQIQVPSLVLDQLATVSSWVNVHASQITMPTLLVQALNDPLVRPGATRLLRQRIQGETTYVEIPGGHEFTFSGSSGYEQMLEAVLKFLERFN